ncbi:DNA mismatch repair protein MutS [Daejeonella sp.]|uniref:MutS-related protein n=1 Tax=Daejeonella sp. TaxID=2805397 RepID=UPI0030BCED02
MEPAVTNQYQINLNKSNGGVTKYEILINRYSVLRLVTIAAGIFFFYQALKFEASWLSVLVFFVVIVCFSLLVRKQNSFEKKRNYFRDLARVYNNEIESINRRQNIYSDGSDWVDDMHSYTSDLDIFGKGSLFELLNRCSTVLGNAKLAGWLKKRTPVQELRERQSAVEELASKQDWKHNLQAVLLFSNGSKEDHVQNLFEYMRTARGSSSMILRIYIKWSPWIFLLSAILAWFYPVFILVIISMGIINLLLMQAYLSAVMKADSLIGKMSKILNHFSEAISAIRSENWDSKLCAELASDLKTDDQGKLPEQIRRLSGLINQLSLGLSSIGAVLNFIMPWNVRQFFAIEDWKKSNKVNVEGAFDVIANFEALISLSSVRSNYPDWTFPKIAESKNYTLTAKSIGHPLIPPNLRIVNDYSLTDDLKIDIITGSNMAGKSTFLRTLGINTILAQCGAPVCAQKMEVSPMLVFSYMRIRDSLNESTSTFKAELDRLQRLLEILRTEDKVYFLIDEMLRGTNSMDKYLGSKAVIEKLIAQNAVGIIATHDLQIAELEKKYPDYIRNFYFDIEIEGAEMKFDYKLKEGECKTFNASLLLKRLGIDF